MTNVRALNNGSTVLIFGLNEVVDIVPEFSKMSGLEFIQDWKGHMGFDSMAIHQGVDGSFRGLTLSLLADHALNFHPEQAALIDAKLPAGTVSSLTKRIKIESLLESIKTLVYSDQPKDAYERMADSLMSIYELNSSKRNMVNVDMKQYEGKAYLAAQFKNAA